MALLFTVLGQGHGRAKLVAVSAGRWREYLLRLGEAALQQLPHVVTAHSACQPETQGEDNLSRHTQALSER